MKLNFLFQTLAAVLTMFCLSSCDGGGGDDGGDDGGDEDPIIDTSVRYDRNALDPDKTAQLPSFLIGFSDEFQLTDTGFSPGLNFPTSRDQPEGTLSPGSAFSMLIRNQRYDYEQNDGEAIITLIEIDPTKKTGVIGTTADRRYENGLKLLEDTGQGNPGPVFDLFLGFPTVKNYFDNVDAFLKDLDSPDPDAKLDSFNSDVLPRVDELRAVIGEFTEAEVSSGSVSLAEAIDEVIGYEAVIFPDAVGVAGFELGVNSTTNKWELAVVHVPIRNALVLKKRTINLVPNPSSTNQQLFDNLEIEGTYSLADEYDVLFATATKGAAGWNLTVSVGGGDLGQAGEQRPEEPVLEGPFVLRFETLGSVAP